MEKFKNGSGKFLLRGLFYERVGADKEGVLYTLKDVDHEGFPSLKRLYLETNDPTEYRFAKKYMFSIEHWDDLCQCDWFIPIVREWRRELFLSLQSRALANIIQEAEKDSQSKLNANKYLLERSWEPKKPASNAVGRPSKRAIQEAAEDIVADNERVLADLDRLNLGSIQ